MQGPGYVIYFRGATPTLLRPVNMQWPAFTNEFVLICADNTGLRSETGFSCQHYSYQRSLK